MAATNYERALSIAEQIVCIFRKRMLLVLGVLGCLAPLASAAEELPDTIARIKPSIVGIGTYQKTRTPPLTFSGTGFVVGNGLEVLTNAHVLPAAINSKQFETLAVFVRENGRETVRVAARTAADEDHDLALLKIGGSPLPAMTLGDSSRVREGETYAFTGYPIGMVLGLHPVTHLGIISAITPVAIPVPQAKQLNLKMLKRLGEPYAVFQLDATAYPGNSGSPLYDPRTGGVFGIINKVFVQETKENLLQKPSGISYAIPSEYALKLLKENGQKASN